MAQPQRKVRTRGQDKTPEAKEKGKVIPLKRERPPRLKKVNLTVRTAYLNCRLFGHAWEAIPEDATVWRPRFGIPIVCKCMRCGMERRDTIDGRGHVAARSYDQPYDYRLPAGEQPLKDDLRIAFIRGDGTRD